MKNWSKVPDGRLTPRQTGRLIVGRKLTSTSISQSANYQTGLISQLLVSTHSWWFDENMEVAESPLLEVATKR
jgi:hypothetical protein